MKSAKTERDVTSTRSRVLVATGDIRGFGRWIKRAGTSIEEQWALISKLYSRVLSLATSKGYYVKMLGDGFLIIRELNETNNWEIVLKDLKLLSCLAKRIQWDIAELPSPRPDGFRIRVVAGHAWKVLARTCPNNALCRNQQDFVGYHINLASRLLHVLPEIPAICHESVKEIVGNRHEIIGSRKNEGFRIDFKRLDDPRVREQGVDPEDLRELWSFKKICRCKKGGKQFDHEVRVNSGKQ